MAICALVTAAGSDNARYGPLYADVLPHVRLAPGPLGIVRLGHPAGLPQQRRRRGQDHGHYLLPAVVPGRMGIRIHVPKVDECGRSVQGKAACPVSLRPPSAKQREGRRSRLRGLFSEPSNSQFDGFVPLFGAKELSFRLTTMQDGRFGAMIQGVHDCYRMSAANSILGSCGR